jgi:4-amino-4-deoxy-L-arabinose transferase-like glycosyltransferase
MTEATFTPAAAYPRVREGLYERLLVATALLGAAALRFFLVFTYRFDSDEPQHLHVAWSWAHGLMQYRDTFDNHMPLFHLLMAPLVTLFGDDPRLLFAARLAMIPLWALCGWAIWRIGSEIFSARVALWGSALSLLVPPFFLGSLEFRTDDLWVALWLLLIVALVREAPLRRKALESGTLLGLAFAVSMKSTLFVASLLLAVVLADVFTGRDLGIRRRLSAVAIGALPAMAIPGAVAAAFALAGAWRPFVYGVWFHNRFPWEQRWHLIWGLPFYYAIRGIAARMRRSADDADLIRKRLFVFFACGLYLAILCTFWPMLSLESYLPFYPLAGLLLTQVLFTASGWLERQLYMNWQQLTLPVICLVLELGLVVVAAKPWENGARQAIELTRSVLRLTSPSEPILDLKGETVFRRRAYYLVFEGITNRKMRLGLLRDDVRQSLIRNEVHVVANANCLPRLVRRFVGDNYVPLGRLHVAGRVLPTAVARAPIAAPIVIPGSYMVIGAHGVISASFDGQPAATTSYLSAGEHRVVLSEACERPIVLWSGASRAYSLSELASMMDRQFPSLTARRLRGCCGHKGSVLRQLRRLDRALGGRGRGSGASRKRH